MAKKSLYQWCQENDKMHIIEQWHPTKNDQNPHDVAHGSAKKAWWKCTNGHEYEAVVHSRAIGSGCPICAGKQVLPGFNDLASQYPEVAAGWHPKNKLMPHEILATSYKKVWWQCHTCGHEYYKAVEQRTRCGRHCSKCNTMTSIAETFICYYLDQINISYEQSYRPVWMKGKEIDVYLAKYNVGIEYDGKLYHQNVERDIEKSQLCAQSDVTLVRIREKGCPELPINNICFTHANPGDYQELTNVLTQLFNYLHEAYQLPLPYIDTIRDMQGVLAMRAKQQYNKSIAVRRPDLLEEWDCEHNIVKPELVSVGSDVKIHWICKKCGHRWQSTASSRAKQNGAGCPVCAGRAVKQGYNDLCTTHPELARQWNYIKNDFSPTEITSGSHKNVWWKCQNEHEWQAVINSRASGIGCPYCSGVTVLAGYNDLASKNPVLAAEWHPTKNRTTPDKVKVNSSKSYWWKCATCRYEFYASIKERNDGIGCSKCAGKRHRGRFRFDLHGIPAGALISFLPNPEMHITVANDMMSIIHNGQTYSLRQFAAEFCINPHTQSTYYFAYQDKRLSEIAHEHNQAAPL